MSDADITALLLTLKLALVSTLLLMVIGIPLAAWLAKKESTLRMIVHSVTALPLILPPTVLGFYLLIGFAPDAWLGKLWNQLFNQPLAFSFAGLIMGSLIYSLPFVIQPLHAGFLAIPESLKQAATVMGASRWRSFRYITLPLLAPSILTATILSFAHTLGEFGVVLMIGGNIPGETQVMSMAIYEAVETQNYDRAHQLSITLLGLSFALLLITYSINPKIIRFSSAKYTR